MIGQTEVIVAREVDYFASIEARHRLAGRFEHAQMLIGAGLAPGFQLLGEIGQWIRSGHSFHPTLLRFSVGLSVLICVDPWLNCFTASSTGSLPRPASGSAYTSRTGATAHASRCAPPENICCACLPASPNCAGRPPQDRASSW